MKIIDQEEPAASALPGIAHSTWVGAEEGLGQLGMWRQSMAPGASTPPHRHDCDEVVLCLKGWGEVHAGGRKERFGPGQTVILPRGEDHQLFSVGQEALETIGVFGATPVLTRLPDGGHIELPWRT